MIATTDGSATRLWRTDRAAVAGDICVTLKAPLTPAEWSTYLPEYPSAQCAEPPRRRPPVR